MNHRLRWGIGLVALLLVLVGLNEARSQTSMFNGFYLTDKWTGETATVTKGLLNTRAQVTHISAAVHVSSIATTVSVNCIAGCSASSSTHTAVTQGAAPWTVAHVSSVLHISAARPIPVTLHMQTGSRLLEAAILAGAIGDNTLVSGAAGQRIRIHRLFFVASSATTIRFRDATADLTGPMPLAANGAVVLDLTGDPWFTTTTGHAFAINQSAGSHLGGRLYYTRD